MLVTTPNIEKEERKQYLDYEVDSLLSTAFAKNKLKLNI